MRARARGGCTVDHIRGRWTDGPTSAITPKQCGGVPTCVWKVRGNRQGAAAFQAFSTPSGSPPKSNVVRVAWAGACTRIGTWRNDVAGTLKLTTTWTIEAGGAAQEAGGGAVSGTATLEGHVLKIVWVSPDQVTTGTYEWTLGPNCRSGQGTLTITAPADRAGQTIPDARSRRSDVQAPQAPRPEPQLTPRTRAPAQTAGRELLLGNGDLGQVYVPATRRVSRLPERCELAQTGAVGSINNLVDARPTQGQTPAPHPPTTATNALTAALAPPPPWAGVRVPVRGPHCTRPGSLPRR